MVEQKIWDSGNIHKNSKTKRKTHIANPLSSLFTSQGRRHPVPARVRARGPPSPLNRSPSDVSLAPCLLSYLSSSLHIPLARHLISIVLRLNRFFPFPPPT